MHEVRDQGGEPVVVAEADLVGGDRVVLVDDRQHAELEQPGRGCGGRCGSGARRVTSSAVSSTWPTVTPVPRRTRRCSAAPAAPGRRSPRPAGWPGPAAGRSRPSGARPAAIAPEETSTTSPARGAHARRGRRPARAAASASMPAGQRGQRGGADLDHDPAGARRSRPRGASLPGVRLVVRQVVVGPGRRSAELVRRRGGPSCARQPLVGAARRSRRVDAGCRCRGRRGRADSSTAERRRAGRVGSQSKTTASSSGR